MPPLIGPDPFIGREREMAELTAALDGALEGRGGRAMLVGEPGEKTLRAPSAQASFQTWDYDDYVGGAGLRCVSDRLR